MPLSKKISKYPGEYLELAMQFESQPSPRRFEFATSREAKRMRFMLYGFKGALALEAPEQYSQFMASEMIVEDRALIIRLPEDNPLIEAIRRGLQTTMTNEQAQAALGPTQMLAAEAERSASEDAALRFMQSRGTMGYSACDTYSGIEPADCDTCGRPFAEHTE